MTNKVDALVAWHQFRSRECAAAGLTVQSEDHDKTAVLIRAMQSLVQCLIENDPDDPISDAGHTVLELWRHDARKLIGMPEK